MRGDTLFQLIAPEPARQGQKNQRNAYLHERNDQLAHRFYFHASICRKSYEACLDQLSREFCLVPSTITTRLGEVTDTLRQLKAAALTERDLAKKYPHYNWNPNHY